MDEQLSTEALAQSSCSIARNPERAAAGWPLNPVGLLLVVLFKSTMADSMSDAAAMVVS